MIVSEKATPCAQAIQDHSRQDKARKIWFLIIRIGYKNNALIGFIFCKLKPPFFIITHCSFVGFDKDGAEIFVWRDIIFKTFYNRFGLEFFPERYPVDIVTISQFFSQ